MNLVTLTVGILVILLSDWIVDFLTNSKFNEAAFYIPILYLTMFSFINGTWHSQYLAVIKKAYILAIIVTTTRFLFLPILGLSTYYFGLLGASICIVLPYFVTSFFAGVYAKKNGSHVDNFFIAIAFTITYIIFLLIKIIVLDQQ